LTIGALGFAVGCALGSAARCQDRPLVVLRLNAAGDAGLERMLQIARHHAGTVDDVNMAVSLDHALYAARAETAVAAAKQAQKTYDDQVAAIATRAAMDKAADDLKVKQDELDKANAEVERLKAALAVKTSTEDQK